jgi:predicted ester cyclase
VCERNKAAARAVFEVWSTGEIERLDELVARHVVHHDPYDPNASEGLVGMKRTIELNRSAFPDMLLTVEDQVAEGDKVVTRWRGEMTHTGKLAGAAPSGRRVTITGTTIDRFEDGRIVEAGRSVDMLGLLPGIGALSGAGRQQAAAPFVDKQLCESAQLLLVRTRRL